MDMLNYIENVKNLLQESIKEPDLDQAMGHFFYHAQYLGIDTSEIALDEILMVCMEVILKVDVNYVYSPKTIVSAVRIYFCYFKKDWFGFYYLDSQYAECQSKWRRNWTKKRHFQAAPRDHGKSHIYSLELPLWNVCYIDNIRILMSSKTDDLAEKYLGAIKRTIETNQKIKEDFGDLTENVNPVDGSLLEGGKGKGGWSKRVLFVRRTNHTLKDGTVESIGWGSAITGSRFDLIILDDPIEEKDCKTKKAREKQKENLHVLEELLEPDGQFLVIGTRKHYGDLYAYILDNPRWTYSIDKGIIKFPEKYEYITEFDEGSGKEVAVDVFIPKGETYEVLWKEKWSIQALLLKKYGSLPLHFLRETQNEVNSDETSDFPKEDIENCTDITQLGRRVGFLDRRPDWAKYVVVSVDLSGVFNKQKAEENNNDYTVIKVIAVDNMNKRHLINAFRERGITPDRQLNKMSEFHYDFNSDVIVLEVNAYQKAMQSMAIDEGLPIYPHNTGTEKYGIEGGLPRLSIELRNKMYIFYTGCQKSKQYYDILFNELHGYGVEDHDDTVMSLWLNDIGVNWLLTKEENRRKREEKRVGKRVARVVKEAQENAVIDNVVHEHKNPPDELLQARKLIEETLKLYQQ